MPRRCTQKQGCDRAALTGNCRLERSVDTGRQQPNITYTKPRRVALQPAVLHRRTSRTPSKYQAWRAAYAITFLLICPLIPIAVVRHQHIHTLVQTYDA